MAYKFVAGPYMNALARAASTPTASPSANTSYPIDNLYDGVPAIPFMFGTSTSDPTVSIDLNQLSDPGFETSTTGWTASSTSTLTQSSTAAFAGTYCGVLSGEASRDAYAQAGHSMRLEWATSVAGGSMRVQLLELNQYLSSTGGWFSTGSTTYVLTNSSTSWVQSSVSFVMPASSQLLSDVGTLRLTILGSSVNFDDIALYPAVSWVSAHGHNWTPALTAQVLGSSNSSTYTTASTMSVYRDVALSTFSTTYYRYWRLKLAGAPAAAPYVGELVFGQYDTFGVNPMYGSTVEYREKQTRKESPAGTVYVYNRGSQPIRTLKMTFYFPSETEYLQSRRSIFRASRGGGNLIAIAASEMESEQVILGRVTEAASYVKTDGVFWGCGYDIVEEALPTIST